MKRRSLEARLCLLITGLLFAVLLAVGHQQMVGQQTALIEEKIDNYESVSNALALMYAPLAQRNDQSLCREFASRFMKADRDISYLVITDAEGRVMFSDTRDRASTQYKGFMGKQIGRLLSLVRQPQSPPSQEFRRIRIPVMVGPGRRGTVAVGFASRSVDAALEEMRSKLILAFALALIAGILGAVSVAKAIVRPIGRLILVAKAVTSGDLDVRVPVSSRDEIGELGDTFNRMIQALKESRDSLIERANTDSLTNLYNHRYFQERLGAELSRSERYGRSLSMIMLDIDHFKTLNDTQGHPVGDEALKELANLLVSQVRDIDVVARYGGEEFALILPETQAPQAMVVAERARRAVARHRFAGKDGDTVRLTISLGVAEYPVHSREREGLIMAADLAMYEAKSMGSNRSVTFSSDIRAEKNPDPYKLYLLLSATDAATVEAIAAAVDAKSDRYPGFSRAVMLHAVAIAQELGMSEEEQNDMRIASLLHDIGKLGISHAILNKKGELTDAERQAIRTHPTLGHSIVQKSPNLKSMLPGILYHHEWWDGNGYPHCLKGEEIPLIARIISVVDAYHAMMTERPHAGARSVDDAKAELKRCSGTQFDPKIVDVFSSILEREEAQAKAA